MSVPCVDVTTVSMIVGQLTYVHFLLNLVSVGSPRRTEGTTVHRRQAHHVQGCLPS